jgi:hypothetical protein
MLFFLLSKSYISQGGERVTKARDERQKQVNHQKLIALHL